MIVLDSSLTLALIKGDLKESDLQHQQPVFSAVTQVAILGDPSLSLERLRLLERLFASTHVLPVTSEVIEQAIVAKQGKMTLHDALVAATAFVNNYPLWTDRPEAYRHYPVHTVNPLNESTRALNALLEREALQGR